MQIEHTTTEVRRLVKNYTLTGVSEGDLRALMYAIDQCGYLEQYVDELESIYEALKNALASD